MELITKAPRGTADLLPSDSGKWRYIEEIIKKVAGAYGYREIRTPMFEHTELFQRSVGDTTDIVQKEMYTFEDKSGRSITLRPENTASAVRLMLENGLYAGALPLKMFYLSSCFRYEKPQAGRLREFHQFGIEQFGADTPSADVEIISVAKSVFDNLGLESVKLNINSIGCKDCRPEYYKKLREYFEENADSLCDTCKERLIKNPMRILDCKNKECADVALKAPVVTDYLCDSCNERFEEDKKLLNHLRIDFSVNPKIVRGLDYYGGIVFEFVTDLIGAQSTVCGGGRYNGLSAEIGGESISGIGFGMGLERLLLLCEAENAIKNIDKPPVIYIANIGGKGLAVAEKLAMEIRNKGIYCEYDIVGRSLKAQMKYADKIGAVYSVCIGDNEADSGECELKNMKTGEKEKINIFSIPEKLFEMVI